MNAPTVSKIQINPICTSREAHLALKPCHAYFVHCMQLVQTQQHLLQLDTCPCSVLPKHLHLSPLAVNHAQHSHKAPLVSIWT